MNHPPEATETPIEIQLSTLRKTLGDDLVRDLEDSVAPNTWRAYRSDLADFATWVAYTSAEWRAPEVVATYLRTLEDGGAAYATITRRLTSIHKLVAIAAIAAGDLDYEDPTKHPRVGVTLQAIRRRLSTDQDQANPLTSQRLLQVLLSIDTATVAGMRDVALLLVGWYGALRRSELAGLERDHLSLEEDGLVLQLPRSKASPDHSVWVPIANQPDSDWNPTARLEDWLEAAARLRPTATEAVWLHVTRGDTVTRDTPITAAAINNMVQRRTRISRWSRERIGVFGAFAAGRVCHRSQEPRDRRGRHHAPHPAQERPDHAPLRPNLRPVDPQCHHRRKPLKAAPPAPVPAAQYVSGQAEPAERSPLPLEAGLRWSQQRRGGPCSVPGMGCTALRPPGAALPGPVGARLSERRTRLPAPIASG